MQSERARAARETIDAIALKCLGLHTLETRNSDGLDFHELAVWEIRGALEAAYTAGVEAGKGCSGSQPRSARRAKP